MLGNNSGYSTREERVEVFQDTLAWINAEPLLSASVAEAKKKTKVYYEDDYPQFDLSAEKDEQIFVTRDRSYQAAMRLVFREESKKNKTVHVLKTPKTESSIRKVFLPRTVAEELVKWRKAQDELKEVLGDEYQDYNLVMSTSFGLPISNSSIRQAMNKLIKENNLPLVVFHSLRHTSVTYKLKLNGGDIKAVQGDSGHSQVNMVTDVYSHIIDGNRKNNAQLFEEAFYGKKNVDPEMKATAVGNTVHVPTSMDAEILEKVLSNPEMAALLTSLARTLTNGKE